MNNDCIFCMIAADPSKLVWEDETVAAFKDLHPDAPVHILIVPKRHVERLSELDDEQLAGHLLMAVRAVAVQAGIGENFQLITNNGAKAGQVVNHLHFHLMGNPNGLLSVSRHRPVEEEG